MAASSSGAIVPSSGDIVRPSGKRKSEPELPRGGYKQKAQWVVATSGVTIRTSKLASVLLDKWAWGVISAPLLQEIAAAAVADGLDHPDLLVMKRLGTDGAHPGNCHKEMLNKLVATPISRSLTSVRVFIKQPPNMVAVMSHSMLLPHELFAALYRDYRDEFVQRILGGSTDNIKKFWDEMHDHPAMCDHPLRGRPTFRTKCVPITIHGDGIPVISVQRSWAKSLDIWSWTSMLGVGNTLMTNFLIYCIYMKLVIATADKDVFAKFSKLLYWSMYWLYQGVWPTKDVDGKHLDGKAGSPLAGGYFAVLWGIRGDLEHMHKCFGFPAHNNREPCACCRANNSTMPWTDFHPERASWLPTVWNNKDWWAAHPARHPLFKLPGVGILAFIPDVMHCLHLGLFQYTYGSILEFMSYHMFDEEDPAINLANVFVEIKNYYKDLYMHYQGSCLLVIRYTFVDGVAICVQKHTHTHNVCYVLLCILPSIRHICRVSIRKPRSHPDMAT